MQVNWYQFVKNVQNMESWDGYKDALKQATWMWHKIKKSKVSGIVTLKSLTIHHIINTINLTHFYLSSYYDVKNETVRKYVHLGKSSDSA